MSTVSRDRCQPCPETSHEDFLADLNLRASAGFLPKLHVQHAAPSRWEYRPTSRLWSARPGSEPRFATPLRQRRTTGGRQRASQRDRRHTGRSSQAGWPWPSCRTASRSCSIRRSQLERPDAMSASAPISASPTRGRLREPPNSRTPPPRQARRSPEHRDQRRERESSDGSRQALRARREAASRSAPLVGHSSGCLAGRDPLLGRCTCRHRPADEVVQANYCCSSLGLEQAAALTRLGRHCGPSTCARLAVP